MYNSNKSTLSKDTIFKASNHTDINSRFNNIKSLESISVSKAKEALQKMLNNKRISQFSVTKRVGV